MTVVCCASYINKNTTLWKSFSSMCEFQSCLRMCWASPNLPRKVWYVGKYRKYPGSADHVHAKFRESSLKSSPSIIKTESGFPINVALSSKDLNNVEQGMYLSKQCCIILYIPASSIGRDKDNIEWGTRRQILRISGWTIWLDNNIRALQMKYTS